MPESAGIAHRVIRLLAGLAVIDFRLDSPEGPPREPRQYFPVFGRR